MHFTTFFAAVAVSGTLIAAAYVAPPKGKYGKKVDVSANGGGGGKGAGYGSESGSGAGAGGGAGAGIAFANTFDWGAFAVGGGGKF